MYIYLLLIKVETEHADTFNVNLYKWEKNALEIRKK